MPSGAYADEPTASLFAGMPNTMNARTPTATSSRASLRSDSIVCCEWPGIDAIGSARRIDSFTNSGAIR